MSSQPYHSVLRQPITDRARRDQLSSRTVTSVRTPLRTSLSTSLRTALRRALAVVRAVLSRRHRSGGPNDLSQFNEHMLRDIGAPERLIAIAAEREGAFCCFPCDITPRRQLFY